MPGRSGVEVCAAIKDTFDDTRVGFRSDVKKAIVTLAEGQSIDVTTGI